MKLIKSLGIQERVNSKGTKVKCTWAVFECPVCKNHVERPQSKGQRNKSCGDKECRKATLKYNYSAYKRNPDATTNNPHYNSFKQHIIKLRNKVNVDIAKTSELWDEYGSTYTELRLSNPGTRITSKVVNGRIIFDIMTTTKHKTKVYAPKDTNYSADKLYILECKGMYKIGIANDIDARIKTLQTGNPFVITCIYSKKLDDPMSLEKYLHSTYKDNNIMLEWFNFDSKTLDNIIQYIEDTVIDTKWIGGTVLKEIPIVSTVKVGEKDYIGLQIKAADKYTSLAKNQNTRTVVETVIDTTPVKRNKINRDKRIVNMYIATKGRYGGAKNLPNSINTIDKFTKVITPIIESKGEEPLSVTIQDDEIQVVKTSTLCTRPVSIEKLDKSTEEVLQEYSSGKEAAESVNGTSAHIIACCRGNRKTHAGYKWRYKATLSDTTI